VQIVDDIRVGFDERPGEVNPLTGIPSADLVQPFFVHFDHVQFEVCPKPLIIELDNARQTAYFHLSEGKR